MAGKVEYEYHYHMDGEGRICDEEYVPESRKGGCYNVSVTHKPTDSCYNIEYRYSYRTRKNCDKLYHVTDRDNGDVPVFRWCCNFCGTEYDSDNGYHSESTTDINVFRDRARSDIELHMDKVKICGYEDGQVLGYRPSCRYVHGQILRAHISFVQNYKDYNSTVDVPSPGNVMTSHIMVLDKSMNIESLLKGFEFIDEAFEMSVDASTEEASGIKEPSIKENASKEKSEKAATAEGTNKVSGTEKDTLEEMKETPNNDI